MTQTWFITGSSRGFGRALARAALEAGDRVAATARRPEQLDDLGSAYPDRLHALALDVTDVTAAGAAISEARERFGRLDVIVNNAGYGLFGAAEEFTDEQVVHEIGTNLLGSIQVVRSALPHLRAQPQARIIQISTYGGQAALPGGSMYHASKWGIEGFSEALMAELAPFNIGVTIIEPGGARTGFRHGSAQLAPALDAYAGTPAAFVRGVLADETQLPPGDPAKMAAVIIGSADTTPAPQRIVLGSDSYGIIVNALTQRLADIEPQKDLAASTDFAAAPEARR